jgi:hypothetical protein
MSIFALIAMIAAEAPLESATLPLPPELRDSASVVSINEAGEVTILRTGSGNMTCIADRAGDEIFDARCYHREFISYLYRRRQLSAQGMASDDIDLRIEQELETGKMAMTMLPTAGYRMRGPITALVENGTAWTEDMWRWQSIHIPRATAEDLGFVTSNEELMPYVMASGRLWAHVMINSPAD